MAIPRVERRDAQVKAKLRLTLTYNNLLVDLAYIVIALHELGPCRKNLASRLPNKLGDTATKNLLCCPVEIHDTILLVYHKHNIAHVLNQHLARYWPDI